MPSSYSPLLRIQLQATGENSDTWGDILNDNFGLIEDSIAAVVTITLSSVNVTLSEANGSTDQQRNAFVEIVGSPATSLAVLIDNGLTKSYIVKSSIGNSNVVMFRYDGGGDVGVSIDPGTTNILLCDGTSVVRAGGTAGNFVTLDTAQSITGTKTFTAVTNFITSVVFSSNVSINSTLYVTSALDLGSVINTKRGADVTAAAVLNVVSATGNIVHVSGTTSVTSFTTATPGITRTLIMDNSVTFVYSSFLITPTSANLATQPGDVLQVVADTSSVWRVTGYEPYSGYPLLNPVITTISQSFATTNLLSATRISSNNTIPLNTQGVECLSISYLPKRLGSKLAVEAVVRAGVGGTDAVAAAIFRGSTTSAVAASSENIVTGYLGSIDVAYFESVSALSTVTWAVRASPNGNTQCALNTDGTTRQFGGVCSSFIRVTETLQ